MRTTLSDLTAYLAAALPGPAPQYLIATELMNRTADAALLSALHRSKWYRELETEQREDGSWGRFHSMDAGVKGVRFATTESALIRARDLALTKDEPLLKKAVALLERYLRGEEDWPDRVETHRDGGRGHLQSRFFITAADLSLLDPENPLLAPYHEACARQIEAAFAFGVYDEAAWRRANEDYTGCCLDSYMSYTIFLLQRPGCIDERLQRKYLDFIWNRAGGIYYISDDAPSQKTAADERRFTAWLSALETLSGFSLFSKYVFPDICQFLEGEVIRLMSDEVTLPSAAPFIGRYSESWRSRGTRRNDLILRIVRLLKKCGDD